MFNTLHHFLLFYSLFLRIDGKHTKRYRNYEQPYEFAYEHTLLTTTPNKNIEYS